MVVALGRWAAGQGNQMSFPTFVQLPVPVDLVAPVQRFLQPLLRIPLPGSYYRPLRDVQGRCYLGSRPALIHLQQNACPGDRLGRTPARPDHFPQMTLFL